MAMAMSPRISFSHDVDLSIDSHHPLDDSTLPNDDEDFDFILASNISYIQDPSPADELFSHGKLLPLSSVIKPAATAPPPSAPPKPSPKKTQLKDFILSGSPSPKPRSSNNSKPPSSPFWSMGRSISVGASQSNSSKSSYFPRSKSTGSYQVQNQRGKSNCYYYSGSGNSGGRGNGVRINPVINVPAPFIPRGGSGGSSSSSTNSSSGSGHNAANSSFFAYLLCHCSSKNGKEIETGYSS